MTDSLTIVVKDNISVWPLAAGSSNSGLKYVLDPQFGQPFDHMRDRWGGPVCISTYEPPPSQATGRQIPGTTLYAGVIFNQFGHFIAESLHRLWPIYTDPALANVPIAYHSAGRHYIRRGEYTGWMRQIFETLKIDMARLILIEEPLTFERLVIPVQGSRLGSGPIAADYSAIFPPPRAGRAASSDPRNKAVYVSRSKFVHGGSFLGEPLVEAVLAEAGVRIVHPQEYPVAEVLDMLEQAEMAIFSEGSALHFLELCRPAPQKVFVISRRSRQAFQNFFETMVTKAAAHVFIHPMVEALMPLGWSQDRQQPMGQNASALVDLKTLVGDLSAFLGTPLRQHTEAEIRQAQALTLLQIIMDERSSGGRTTAEDMGRLLFQLRHQVNRLDFLPWPPPPGSASEARAGVPPVDSDAAAAADRAVPPRPDAARRRAMARRRLTGKD